MFTEGQKLRIYFNLHKKCLSVQDAKTRKVIAHVPGIQLKDVVFKVSESGRQRVLREQRKNVHAFIEGYYSSKVEIENHREVTYNPYKYSTFVDREQELPIERAEKVIVEGRRILV